LSALVQSSIPDSPHYIFIKLGFIIKKTKEGSPSDNDKYKQHSQRVVWKKATFPKIGQVDPSKSIAQEKALVKAQNLQNKHWASSRTILSWVP
jgi:hypothetical protein